MTEDSPSMEYYPELIEPLDETNQDVRAPTVPVQNLPNQRPTSRNFKINGKSKCPPPCNKGRYNYVSGFQTPFGLLFNFC